MIFSNATIILEDKVLKKGVLEITEGIITKVYESDKIVGIDLDGAMIFPGFIDTHIHGSNGIDFMDYDQDLNIIYNGVLNEGTTSLLATTMTQDLSRIKKSLKNIAFTKSTGARNLGVHLEGPFLNIDFCGAQDPNLIIKGSKEVLRDLLDASNNQLRIITVAPEEQDDIFLKEIRNQGLISSIGHTSSNANDVRRAISLGCTRVTHGYNAMSKFHHRDIGVVGSMFLYDVLSVELIADLHHSSADAIKLLHKIKSSNNVMLVTDSIRAKNMPDGVYDLGGSDVTVTEGNAFIGNTIAGSTLKFNVAVKNYFYATECSLVDLAKVSSTNQAKELSLDKLGKIEVDFFADLTILDSNFDVLYTIVGGEIKYKRGQYGSNSL